MSPADQQTMCKHAASHGFVHLWRPAAAEGICQAQLKSCLWRAPPSWRHPHTLQRRAHLHSALETPAADWHPVGRRPKGGLRQQEDKGRVSSAAPAGRQT